jgi:hypothetical protein
MEPYREKFKLWRYDKDGETIYMYLHIAKELYGEQSSEYKDLTSNSREELQNIMTK